MKDFATSMSEGMRWQSERDWRRAAGAFEAAARGRRGPGAGQAWRMAGECWRRDDELARAQAALERCLNGGADAEDALLAEAQLAAVLAERGEGEAALARGEAALATAEGSPRFALVADTHLTHLLGALRLDVARALAARLVGAGGPEAVAGRYRLAQVDRLAGDFDGAEAHLRAVIAALHGRKEATVGVAAAEAELGEVALMRGDFPAAIAWMTEAHRKMGEAQRGALRWRAEAARVRGLAEAGAQVLADGLDAGVRFAEARGMKSLRVDLLLAIGASRSVSRPGEALAAWRLAARLAGEMGATLRMGRANLGVAQAAGVPTSERALALGVARAALAPSPPWFARCQAMIPAERAAARDAFAGFGMLADLQRLDAPGLGGASASEG